MSNEELVLQVQSGNEDAVLQLWQQVRGFVFKRANSCHKTTGYELDDLMQSGFIALLIAASTFDPERGASFIHYLSFHLHNEFNMANGLGIKFNDPLERAISLNNPLYDDPNGSTLEDVQADPGDQYSDLIDKIFLEELQAAVNKAVEALPDEQKEVLHSRFWENLTIAETSRELDRPEGEVRKLQIKALRKLSQQAQKYGLREFIEERTPYYLKVGADEFLRTHESATEKIVFYRDNLEKKYGQRD